MGPSADVALRRHAGERHRLKIARRIVRIVEVSAVRACQGVIVHRDHVMEACAANRPNRAWAERLGPLVKMHHRIASVEALQYGRDAPFGFTVPYTLYVCFAWLLVPPIVKAQ